MCDSKIYIRKMIKKLNDKMDSLKEDVDKIKEALNVLDVADATFEPKSNFGKETFNVYVGDGKEIDREFKRIFPDCIDTFFYKDSKGRERLDFTLKDEDLEEHLCYHFFTIIYEGKKHGWRLKLWKNKSKKRIVANEKISNPGPWCIEAKVKRCILKKYNEE